METKEPKPQSKSLPPRFWRRTALGVALCGLATLVVWVVKYDVTYEPLAKWHVAYAAAKQSLPDGAVARWYKPVGARREYVVRVTEGDRSAGFWFRLDGAMKGADGGKVMGFFTATEGGCCRPDGSWMLTDAAGEFICKVHWCHGQICGVSWTESSEAEPSALPLSPFD